MDHLAATTPATCYQDHTVIGTPAQINNVIANHAAAGTLIARTHPRPMPGTDARFRIRVRLAAAPPLRHTRPAPRNRRAGRVVALVVAAAVGVIAAAAYLLGLLVAFVTAHAAEIIGGLAVAAVLAAVIGSRRTGRHCPGC